MQEIRPKLRQSSSPPGRAGCQSPLIFTAGLQGHPCRAAVKIRWDTAPRHLVPTYQELLEALPLLFKSGDQHTSDKHSCGFLIHKHSHLSPFWSPITAQHVAQAGRARLRSAPKTWGHVRWTARLRPLGSQSLGHGQTLPPAPVPSFPPPNSEGQEPCPFTVLWMTEDAH